MSRIALPVGETSEGDRQKCREERTMTRSERDTEQSDERRILSMIHLFGPAIRGGIRIRTQRHRGERELIVEDNVEDQVKNGFRSGTIVRDALKQHRKV